MLGETDDDKRLKLGSLWCQAQRAMACNLKFEHGSHKQLPPPRTTTATTTTYNVTFYELNCFAGDSNKILISLPETLLLLVIKNNGNNGVDVVAMTCTFFCELLIS